MTEAVDKAWEVLKAKDQALKAEKADKAQEVLGREKKLIRKVMSKPNTVWTSLRLHPLVSQKIKEQADKYYNGNKSKQINDDLAKVYNISIDKE